MFGVGFTRELKSKISNQENQIRIFKEKKLQSERDVQNRSLYIVKLVAENASLKTEVNQMEARYDNMVKFKDITIGRLEKELEEYRLLEVGRHKVISKSKLKRKSSVDGKKSVHPNLQAYYNRGKSKNK